MLKRIVPLLLCTAALAAVVGCGSSGEKDSANRPPVTAYVGVLLDGKATHLSPQLIGGGPVTLKITNQSKLQVQRVTLRPRYIGEGCVENEAIARQIPAGGTGTIKAILIEGGCEVVADGYPATSLTVGPERPIAENKLLLL